MASNERIAKLEEHFLEHSNEIFHDLWVKLGVREDAEDALQEIFKSAFRSLDTLRDENKLGNWITVIAANVITRKRYKRYRQKEILAEHTRRVKERAEEEAKANKDRSPAEVELVQAEEIEVGLQQVPEEQRLPLLMFNAGKAIPEIAQELGIPLQRAHNRIRAARLKLAKWLRDREK